MSNFPPYDSFGPAGQPGGEDVPPGVGPSTINPQGPPMTMDNNQQQMIMGPPGAPASQASNDQQKTTLW